MAVADSQHRYAGVEKLGVHLRAAWIVNAGRATGKDHTAEGRQLLRGRVGGQDLSEDAELANLPGDQVSVLADAVELRDLVQVSDYFQHRLMTFHARLLKRYGAPTQVYMHTN